MSRTFSIWLGVTFPEIPPVLALECTAIIITVRGELMAVKPQTAESKTFSLGEVQGYVGGHVETLRFKHGLILVNESGRLSGAPVNKAANHFLHGTLRKGEFYVGNVMVCKESAAP